MTVGHAISFREDTPLPNDEKTMIDRYGYGEKSDFVNQFSFRPSEIVLSNKRY